MEEMIDINRKLMLDANGVAGFLYEIFGMDMTAEPTECVHCGKEGEMGELLAFTHGPGVVLRCSACENVMIRIVRAPDAIYLDTRGTAYLRITTHKVEPPNDSLGG